MKLIYSNFEYGLRSPQKRIITIIKDMDLGPFSLKSLTAKGWFAACSNIWATSLCCLSKFIVLLKSLTLYDEREREPIFWSINMGILGIYIYICMYWQGGTKEERKRSWEIPVAREMVLAVHVMYGKLPTSAILLWHETLQFLCSTKSA